MLFCLEEPSPQILCLVEDSSGNITASTHIIPVYVYMYMAIAYIHVTLEHINYSLIYIIYQTMYEIVYIPLNIYVDFCMVTIYDIHMPPYYRSVHVQYGGSNIHGSETITKNPFYLIVSKIISLIIEIDGKCFDLLVGWK